MTSRRSFPSPGLRVEGATFVATEYGNVLIKPQTEAWFLERYASKRLLAHTVRRRANDALVATVAFLAENAWRNGKQLEEV